MLWILKMEDDPNLSRRLTERLCVCRVRWEPAADAELSSFHSTVGEPPLGAVKRFVASPSVQRSFMAIGSAMLIMSSLAVSRADRSRDALDSGGVDTEHLFGFTEGTDIGAAGEREVESDSTFLYGKRSGSFANASSELEFKYTALQNFRISTAATFAYYDIAGAAGLENRRQAAAQSVSFDARLRLFDREHYPFGLTLGIEPHLGFADETSGVPIHHFGVGSQLLADREIVPNRLFGALNLLFDTDRTRLLPTGGVEQEPTLGVGTALAVKATPGIWVGAEARYLRGYEGATFNVFSGQGLYAGPTLYARLGEKIWLSAAWNVQVWGGAAGVSGALDLVNFDRQQIKFRLGYDF